MAEATENVNDAQSKDRRPRLIAGAMSGTSADGVDVAIVEVAGRGLQMQARPLVHAYEPFTAELRRQILEVRQRGEVALADLAEIGRQVTLAYVRALRAALRKGNLSADQVTAIAAHGQTLYHGPPNTIQYFDPSLLAWETGCQVVSDFRRADLAAGGQGAPLVPFADWILFRHPTRNRVILNIGGIANITYLKAGGAIDEVIAFDTGPGNCISDWLAHESGLVDGVDQGGALALTGQPHFPTAAIFARCKYVFTKPPKSTDGPAMIREYLDCERQVSLGMTALRDRLATAAMAVAHSILLSFDAHLLTWRDSLDEIWVGGGGVRNAAITGQLHAIFDQTRVRLHASLPGQDVTSLDLSSAREAIAFALLGAATLDGEPSNVPSATGASRRVVLGSVTAKPLKGER